MKKSLYILLCSLMGALLFLILHRIVVFVYLGLLDYNYSAFSLNLSYIEFLALDYFTLILALLGGMWYGIWVGVFWYESIYQHNTHGGFVDHLIVRFWPSKAEASSLKSRISAASKKVEDDVWNLEDLAKDAVSPTPVSVKKRIVRRK